MTRAHRWVILLASVIVTGLTACSQAQPSTPPPTSITATTSTTTPLPIPTTWTPSTSTATSSSAPPTGCRSGTVMLPIRSGPSPAPMCLRIGGMIQFTAESSPRQPWQPLTSSAPGVLRCQSHPAVEGSIDGSCSALAAGSATLHTSTAPFAGDPHGPPQLFWDLTVTVGS